MSLCQRRGHGELSGVSELSRVREREAVTVRPEDLLCAAEADCVTVACCHCAFVEVVYMMERVDRGGGRNAALKHSCWLLHHPPNSNLMNMLLFFFWVEKATKIVEFRNLSSHGVLL